MFLFQDEKIQEMIKVFCDLILIERGFHIPPPPQEAHTKNQYTTKSNQVWCRFISFPLVPRGSGHHV